VTAEGGFKISLKVRALQHEHGVTVAVRGYIGEEDGQRVREILARSELVNTRGARGTDRDGRNRMKLPRMLRAMATCRCRSITARVIARCP
jgi:hypothetical protein